MSEGQFIAFWKEHELGRASRPPALTGGLAITPSGCVHAGARSSESEAFKALKTCLVGPPCRSCEATMEIL